MNAGQSVTAGFLRRTPTVPTPLGYRTGYRRHRSVEWGAQLTERTDSVITVVVTAGARLAATGTFAMVSTRGGTVFTCLALRVESAHYGRGLEVAYVALAKRVSGCPVMQTNPGGAPPCDGCGPSAGGMRMSMHGQRRSHAFALANTPGVSANRKSAFRPTK